MIGGIVFGLIGLGLIIIDLFGHRLPNWLVDDAPNES
jgi:hypothetical protein